MKKLINLLPLIFISIHAKAQIAPLAYFQFENNYNNQTPLPVGTCSTATNILSAGNSSIPISTGIVSHYCNFVSPLSGTLAPSNSCALSVPNSGTNSQYISFELLFKADANCGLQDVLSLFRVLGAGERYTAGFEYTPDGGSDVANIFFITPSPTLNINNNPGPNNNLAEFERFKVNLNGIDKKKWDYYFDGNWHHIVFWYDGVNGVKRIYIDGELPNGFEIIANTNGQQWQPENTLSTNENNDFYLLNNNFNYRFLGSIDELAIYAGNTALPEGQILQHYNEIQNGSHYTQALAGGTIPTPNYNGTLILDDFAQGHVLGQGAAGSINCTSAITQIRKFPTARFKPGNNFNRNSNWMSNKHMGGFPGTGIPNQQQINNALAIQIELATNWNYRYLLCENTSTLGNPHEDVVTGAFVQYAIDNPVPDLGWSINTYRAQLRYDCTAQQYGQREPFIKTQMMNSIAGGEHYLFDGTNYINGDGNPVSPVPDFDECEIPNPDDDATAVYAPKLSNVNDYDGDAIEQANRINVFISGNSKIPSLAASSVKIQYISENNEVSPVFSDYASTSPYGHFGNSLWKDASVRGEALVTGSTNSNLWFDYLGNVKRSIDNRYSDANKQGLPGILTNSIISGIFSPDIFFLNYAVDGMPQYRFNYEQLRETQSSIGGKRYSTADFYPRVPATWSKLAFSANHGFKWMSISRNQELMFDDTRIAPFVSAGWDHDEEKNIRPAQWLALLKAVGLMGVDFFHTGFFNETNISANPKGYIWQASTPVYTQAVLTRLQPFFDNGFLMPGDLKYHAFDNFYSAQHGNTAQYNTDGNTYRFNAGSQSRLVVARKMNGGAPVYAITASVQPISNVAGNVTDNQIAVVNLDAGISNLKIKANRQGSTYYFDNTNTLNPIFYQLDKWHENTHPDRWTSDFDFEAEVFDNINSLPTVATIDNTTGNPIQPINGVLDFTNYTSFVKFELNEVNVAEYYFQPRADGVANDYNFYLLARNANNTNAVNSGIKVELFDGANILFTGTITCIQQGSFQWYNKNSCNNFTDITFNGLLDDVNYRLVLTPLNETVEIDRIYLDAADGIAQPATLLASCPNTITYNAQVISNITVSNSNIFLTGSLTINGSSSTFTNCSFYLLPTTASGGTRIYMPGSGNTVTFTNCDFIPVCGTMWTGLRIDNNSGITSNLTMTGNRIQQAITAIDARYSNVVTLTDNFFDRNNTGISLYIGDYAASTINNNIFSCGQGIIGLPPHLNSLSSSHINCISATGFNISNGNVFHNAMSAIISDKSSGSISNNIFEFLDLPTNVAGNKYAMLMSNKGWNNPISNVKITGNTVFGNEFNNWFTGVVSNGLTSIEIFGGNTFTGMERANFISNGQAVYVNDNNYINNNYGIWLYDNKLDMTTTALQEISNNHFNDGNIVLNPAMNYSAIRIESLTLMDPDRIPKFDVMLNQIYNNRTGIHIRNQGAKIFVEDNYIENNQTANNYSSGNPFRGILLENSSYITVQNNNQIKWIGTPTSAEINTIRGIELNASKNCTVKENKTINMGSGIRFKFDCTNSKLFCNTMQGNWHGVWMDGSGINTTVSTQGDWTGSAGTSESWKNQWLNNGNSNKVFGAGLFGAPVLWLYNPADGANYSPAPSNQYVFPQSVSNSEGCLAPAMQMNAIMREENFGDAVYDTIITDPDSSIFKYQAEVTFYNLATNEPTMLTLGVATDNDYQEKYDELGQSNIGKFQEIKDDIKNDEQEEAMSKLLALQDQNLMESNKKFVLEAYINYYTDDTIEPDTALLIQLENIAWQHPFYGGEAVWMARAMLKLDIEDEVPALRKAHTENNAVKTGVSEMYWLSPNPATNNTTIHSKQPFTTSSVIEITDVRGMLITKYIPKENSSICEIRTNTLKQGIYYCKVYCSGLLSETKRLVIIK